MYVPGPRYTPCQVALLDSRYQSTLRLDEKCAGSDFPSPSKSEPLTMVYVPGPRYKPSHVLVDDLRYHRVFKVELNWAGSILPSMS